MSKNNLFTIKLKVDPVYVIREIMFINDSIKIKHMQGFQICPFCGGKTEYAGISSGHIFPALHTGQMYVCRECGYQGSFIIEVDNPGDVKEIKEALHGYKENIEKSVFSFPEKWRGFWKLMLFVLVTGLVIKIIGLIIMIF